MSANFPTSKKTFTQIVDGVTYVEGVNVNTVYDEVEAIQTYLGASGEPQSENSALNNIFRTMFCPLPQTTWIDEDTIEIGAGTVVMFNGNDYVIKRNSTALQIELSADLDTGVEAGDTWYDIYLIGDGVSTTFTAKFVLQGNTPSGATYYKKIMSVRNDSGSDILNYVQAGNWVLYDDPILVLNDGAETSFTDIDLSAYIPVIGKMANLDINTSSEATLKVRTNGSASTNGQVYLCYASAVNINIMVDSNRYIEYQISAGNIDVYVLGFYIGGSL